MSARTAALWLCVGLGASLIGACRPRQVAPPPQAAATATQDASSPLDRPLTPRARRWVEATLGSLSLERKAAQLVFVRAPGYYQNPRTSEARALRELVEDVGVGGVIVFDCEVDALPRLLNGLQRVAAVPLLVAADLERGLAFRVRRGVVPLPYAMAVGATHSEQAARTTGEITAREARALGIHWGFAPVADVNNNPANPVINIRSYGEDPEWVARLTAAFVRGARAGGLLTTVKHFPGHGDTAIDTHLALATVAADRARLDAVELLPFRRAIEARVDAVMLGHVAVPALDAQGTPASLSQPITTGLLRGALGFGGLIVTDALEMEGVRPAWTGEAAVRAVQAGADLVLMPTDARVATQALVHAVHEGQLSVAQIDAALRRLLEAKARLGLHEQRLVDPEALAASVGRPEDSARALDIARASLTVVRNQDDVLPLHAEEPLRVLHVVLASDAGNSAIQGTLEEELTARRVPFETRSLGPEPAAAQIDALVAAASQATHVVASVFVQVRSRKGTTDMVSPHVEALRRLAATGRPLIVFAFGSPYLLAQAPELRTYVCAYGAAESSQRAAIGLLFGEFAARGRLPVTLPGLAALGAGVQIPARSHGWSPVARPEDAGFRADGLRDVDALLERFVAERAFPGAVLAVGHAGRLAHLRAYGRLSYDPQAAPVAVDTLYDIASLTKVVATTTMAMMLVDERRLDLERPVQAFLPGFRGEHKDVVTVRHLLTHSSGLDWWAPLFKELTGHAAYLERIQALPLVYPPGSKSLYSDLGVILLGEILERVAGESLERFTARRLFGPLGMHDTRYRPGRELLARVAPTERDAWRGRVLRGEVHDENAFALGGVAPHAGLFSSAPDLARFAQLLADGGVFENRRLVARTTVELFTRRAGVPASSRALGWDTKSEGSAAGTLFSDQSFGHTGFTGTSLWVDPTRRLFAVLLTNRVHPTRENQAIRQARPAVHDAIVRALVTP
jgi:beta-glucosidase-like glycosyl hydrolase/CubicO group peptidase (beta-lactamase class C family)